MPVLRPKAFRNDGGVLRKILLINKMMINWAEKQSLKIRRTEDLLGRSDAIRVEEPREALSSLEESKSNGQPRVIVR